MIVTRKNGRKRFIGIGKEAERLGVSPAHLWMVLTGKRTSTRLMKRIKIRVGK